MRATIFTSPRPARALSSPHCHALALLVATLASACSAAPSPAAPDASLPDVVHIIVDASPDVAPLVDTPDVAPLVPALTFWSDSPGGPTRVDTLRYGDAFTIRATGLAPGARVTLHSRIASYHGNATFTASARGDLDLSRDAALDGTYTGVDRDGLVWSMLAEGTTPTTTLDLRFELELDDATVAQATLARPWLNTGLRSRMVTDNGMVGQLFAPDDGAPHPAIMVLGGSEGGLSTSLEAAYLAAHGYTALALAYFGVAPLPATLTRIPLEYFSGALTWLAAQPEVDATRLAVLGSSRGGELALILGATYPQLRAVVAIVPSHVVWPGIGASAATVPAWTSHGAPLPFMPDVPGEFAAIVYEDLPSGDQGERDTPAFNLALDRGSPDLVRMATIAVEETHAPILMLGGSDDGLWPSCRFAAAAMTRLRSTEHASRYADNSVCYVDAGHLFGVMPGWSTTGLYAINLPARGWLITGGTPAGSAHAQRAAQEALFGFLATALR